VTARKRFILAGAGRVIVLNLAQILPKKGPFATIFRVALGG
jgi:hypothetical protein